MNSPLLKQDSIECNNLNGDRLRFNIESGIMEIPYTIVFKDGTVVNSPCSGFEEVFKVSINDLYYGDEMKFSMLKKDLESFVSFLTKNLG